MGILIVHEADDGSRINEDARRLPDKMIKCLGRGPNVPQVDSSALIVRMNPQKLVAKINPDVLVNGLICRQHVMATDGEGFFRFEDFADVWFGPADNEDAYGKGTSMDGPDE
jgi:hypothetical protein